jgi:hypothetical protein
VLGILLSICIVLLAANLWQLSQPARPDPRLVALAVRATVYAVPTATPRIVEVTRVVEITVVAPTATATITPTATPVPQQSTVPVPLPLSLSIPGDNMLGAGAGSVASMSAKTAPLEEVPEEGGGEEASAADVVSAVGAAETAAAGEDETAAELAVVQPSDPASCPDSSGASFTTVPVVGGGISYPDSEHADLNLSLRGYSPTDVTAALFDKDGPVDDDPPQLAGIFTDYRAPVFGQAYRVNDWDWSCGGSGCRLGPLDHVAATLITLAAGVGEALGIPHRRAQIYGGGYKALVLYAEPTQITLGYTRDDSVANGYTVHLEGICVDPNLVALYRSSNAAGRGFLPALREDEVLGTAPNSSILVAVRDRGVFFDPRSRLDWWQGF